MTLIKKLIAGASLLPAIAFAQPTLPPPPIQEYGDVQNFLNTAMRWMFGVLITLAVVFIIVAAYKYLTAAGNPEKVKSASMTLIYAAIAVAVALLALGIPTLIGNFFGTDIAPGE